MNSLDRICALVRPPHTHRSPAAELGGRAAMMIVFADEAVGRQMEVLKRKVEFKNCRGLVEAVRGMLVVCR